jgi:apolipoprotein N-acyltransferase
VTISNDTWYGSSSAAYQHLEMARLRAIENGRYVLRATNDGVTAVIDPYGRVLERTPRQRAIVLAGNFDYRMEKTFYTVHGDVFAWLCVVIVLAFGTELVWRRRREMESSK